MIFVIVVLVLVLVKDVEAFEGGNAIVETAIFGGEAVISHEPLLEKEGVRAWKARTVPVGSRFERLDAVERVLWPAFGTGAMERKLVKLGRQIGFRLVNANNGLLRIVFL
ncbi:hypothetical protein QYF36_009373 [Acer negundo]|nr:hypothetical protein QYF36_009373 [Acer negundo]